MSFLHIFSISPNKRILIQSHLTRTRLHLLNLILSFLSPAHKATAKGMLLIFTHVRVIYLVDGLVMEPGGRLLIAGQLTRRVLLRFSGVGLLGVCVQSGQLFPL